MDMDVQQGPYRQESAGGEASPAPRGRPGRRGAEEKTQAVLEVGWAGANRLQHQVARGCAVGGGRAAVPLHLRQVAAVPPVNA